MESKTFRLVRLKKSSKNGDTWVPLNDILYESKDAGLKDIGAYQVSDERNLVARCIPSEHMVRVVDVVVPHWGYPY